MTDRQIRCDIPASQLTDGQATDSDQQARREPGDDDLSRFRRALSAHADESLDGDAQDDTQHPQQPGIFGLFGGVGSRIATRGDRARDPEDGVCACPVDLTSDRERHVSLADLADMVERVLVSDDGEREVRVQISNEVLPGVELSIVQDGGRWVVHFVVGDAASLALLRRTGRTMVSELARRLRQAVEVRISSVSVAAHGGDEVIFSDPRDEGGDAQ